MSKFFEELKQALEEALAYERGEIDLLSHKVTINEDTGSEEQESIVL